MLNEGSGDRLATSKVVPSVGLDLDLDPDQFRDIYQFHLNLKSLWSYIPD